MAQDILGNNAISFVPPEDRAGGPETLPPNTVVNGRTSEDPTGLKRALSGPIRTVKDTGEALREASKNSKAAARNFKRILNAEKGQIQDMLRNAAEALGAIQQRARRRETQRRFASPQGHAHHAG